ncbi:polypyrimidine tract-binding homolog 1 isoform X3 [Olea europaea subsp. europaea]|uniref:Polypyrimidine tract-binding homolog 1 isoform X3 n=1 Tax=Olea europaea subsp. europaea TaxID=158383 RepID=A0A8S0VKV7_OLEEU|nr:polypyrimidine tract-binding homolog 1 isoform X3 [Olea europaea subsp. europaea]
MSTSGQLQFRYTQTPSKVLHLRNLPWKCTEEELVELCKPFGKIVNTKGKSAPIATEPSLNSWILIRQLTWLHIVFQLLNHHRFVAKQSISSTRTGMKLSTTRLLEMFQAISCLFQSGELKLVMSFTWHIVFSAFGFVHKIATFEKSAGFQALIQYSDVQTAATARESLDGRSIPRYLLPGHVNECHLRISYSAHTDLNIKFQSHRSRDYTNPYLPVNPTAMEGFVQPVVGHDGKNKEVESNMLLASIENMQYAVNVDVLHTVLNVLIIVSHTPTCQMNCNKLIATNLISILCIWYCPKDCNI